MRHKYHVTGPHPGTTYPEFEVEDERGFTVAYVHYLEQAEIIAEALNKKRKKKK